MLTVLTLLLVSVAYLGAVYADDEVIRTVAEDILMPKLGLGTAGLRSKTEWVTLFALNSGVKLIDTAQAYEWYDEAAVGKAVNEYLDDHRETEKDQVFIVTKIHPRSFELDKMRHELQITARHFHYRKLDVVLLHNSHCWPGSCTAEEEEITWKEAWTNLEQLKNEFNIHMIGVSNFDKGQLEELILYHSNHKVSVIQNWMDPFHQDKDVRRFANEYGIQYMAYSSFGTQWYRHSKNPVFNNPILIEIANKYRTTVSQVVISWLLRENVIAIPRCSTIQHLQENFQICREDGNELCEINGNITIDNIPVPLEDGDIDRIRSLDGSIGTPWE
eukprot:gene7639-8248_t